jgi:diguanylate cyclase (GGDEF)-like protein/PAS domain S-box-containing protein
VGIESLEDGVVVVDAGRRITYVNPAASTYAGRARDELVGADLGQVFPEALGTRFERRLGRALADRVNDEFVEEDARTGRSLRIRVLASPGGATITHRDVTDEVEANRRLRLTQEIARTGTWEWEVATGAVTWSDEMYRVLGLDPETTTPSIEASLALVHPDDLERFTAASEQAQAGHGPFDLEHRIVRPGGDVRVVHGRGVGVRGEDGSLVRMIGTIHDVTDRARAEQELRESEGRLALAQEIAQIGTWEWDVPTGELTWTAEVYRIFGLDPERGPVTFDAYAERIHPDDREAVDEVVRGALSSGEPFELVHRILRPDGVERHVRGLGKTTLYRDGAPVRMTGTVRDVTDEVRAERELRERESLLGQAREVAGLGVYTIDLLSGEGDASADLARLFEVPPDGGAGAALERIRPDHRDAVSGSFERTAREGEPFDETYPIVRPSNGSERWVRSHALRLGERIVGTVIDITDQVEQERRLTLAQEIAHIGTWEWEPATGDHTRTDEVYRVYGLDPEGEPITYDAYLERIHPDDREDLTETIERALASGEPFEVEHRVLWPDGTERIVRGQGRATLGADDSPARLTGTAFDVTDRALAERALRESESLLAQAQEIAGLGVWTLDPATGATEISPEIQRLYEIGPADGLDEVLPRIHPDYVDAVMESFEGTLREGEPFAMTYPIRRLVDGGERWVRSHARLVGDRAIGTIMDITEQVEQERLLARAQEIAHLATWQWDPTTGESTWTEEMFRILGLDPEDGPDRDAAMALTHPADLPLLEEAYRALLEEGAPFDTQHRIVRPDGVERIVSSQCEVSRAPDGTPLRVVGVTLDVTERARAEEELRRSEASLARAQGVARVGSWEVDVAAGLTAWSEETYRITGIDRETYDHTTDAYIDYVHPDDRPGWREVVIGSVERGEPFEYQYRLIRPDGEQVTLVGRGEPERAADGTITRYFGTVQDVTERVRVEDELRRSRATLAFAQRVARVGSWELDVDTGRMGWSGETYRVTGLDPEAYDHAPEEFLAHVHPDDRARFEDVVYGGVSRGESFACQYRFLRPDGVEVILDGRGAPELGPGGAPVRYVGTIQDVTERVRVEEALRHSEASLASAQRVARMGSWEMELATRRIRWSEETFRILGIDPETFDGSLESFLARIHPDDRTGFDDVVMQAIGRGEPFEHRYRILRPDGAALTVTAKGAPEPAGGPPERYVGSVEDVTERTRAEEALRRSEAALARAQRVAGVGSWEMDIATSAITWSAETFRIVGLDPRTFVPGVESFLEYVHPDDREAFGTAVAGALETGEPFEVQYRVTRPDGREISLIGRGELEHAPDGTPVRMTGTIQDVTGRVRAEEALRRSEAGLARAQRVAQVGSWEVDLDTGRSGWSEEMHRITGIDRDAVPLHAFAEAMESFLAMVREGERERLVEAVSGAVERAEPFEVEFTLTRPDAGEVTLVARGTTELSPDGTPARLIGTLQDVTGRVAAERALRESEARFRDLAALAPVGIFETDLDGACRWVNERWCEIAGIDAEEAMGAGWIGAVHPEDREGLIVAWRRAARIREPLEREYRMVSEGGRTTHVVARLVMLEDGGGEPSGWIGTIVDVTERARREREQRALRRVATAVAGEDTPRSIFALVAAQVADALEVETCSVVQLDPDQGALVVGTWAESEAALRPGDHVATDDDALLGRVRRSGVAIRTSSTADVGEFVGRDAVLSRAESAAPAPCALAAPVWMGRGIWGAIVIGDSARDLAPESEDRLERFCELVSLALAGADARRQLALLASTDHLTGLPNRRSFEERLGAEVARARRHDRDLALVVVDIDNFKHINDAWGHEVGDRTLAELARRLAAHARSGETVARIGGEEFAWILPEADAMGGVAAADRARRAIAATPFPDVGRVSISGGVCDLEQASGPTDLFRKADVALYWAKEQGRDAVFRYAPGVIELLSADEQRDRLERAKTLSGLRVLAHAIDAKDNATQEHSRRVAELAAALAHERGWDIEAAARIREAGVVHDVGKIGVRDAILLKPDRLSAAEFGEVREHPSLGARMIEGLLSAEQVAWVRHHHERWDGSGYPDGLAGRDIPEGARILALADAFDAMTTQRPYAAGLTVEGEVAEARRVAGRQFDAEVVDALERLASTGELAAVLASASAEADAAERGGTTDLAREQLGQPPTEDDMEEAPADP